MIAGVCPLDTEILAAVTQYYHLTLVSKTFSSPKLLHINNYVLVQISFMTSSTGPDEDKLYPYHFHVVPALSHIARGIADFISFHGFGWQRVVIITQDQKSYKKVASYIIV